MGDVLLERLVSLDLLFSDDDDPLLNASDRLRKELFLLVFEPQLLVIRPELSLASCGGILPVGSEEVEEL